MTINRALTVLVSLQPIKTMYKHVTYMLIVSIFSSVQFVQSADFYCEHSHRIHTVHLLQTNLDDEKFLRVKRVDRDGFVTVATCTNCYTHAEIVCHNVTWAYEKAHDNSLLVRCGLWPCVCLSSVYVCHKLEVTFSGLLPVCWPRAQVHETITFLLVTFQNIHRFKNKFQSQTQQ